MVAVVRCDRHILKTNPVALGNSPSRSIACLGSHENTQYVSKNCFLFCLTSLSYFLCLA